METITADKIVLQANIPSRHADQNLVESIRENGVLDPVIVYRSEGRLILLDGHRRLDALKRIGNQGATIPFFEMDTPADSSELRSVQIILNQHHEDVKPTQIAEAMQELKDKGWKQKKIASKFALSDSQVSLLLSLNRADSRIKKAVDSGRVSMSAMEPLLSKDRATQAELVAAAIQAKTVRRIGALVKAHEMKSSRGLTSNLPEDIDPMEVLLREELGQVLSTLEEMEDASIKDQHLRLEIINYLDVISRVAKRRAEEISANIIYAKVEAELG
jgi:ParB family chromosome partitioning protein